MSWQLVRTVFECSQAKPMARLVLLNLAEHAGEGRGYVAWPSLETIAGECGLSLRGTHDLLRYLRKIGEIEFTDGKCSGRGHSNRYHITLKKGDQDAGLPMKQTVQPDVKNPAPNAPEPEEPERVPPLKSPPSSKSAGRLKPARSDFGW